MHLNKLLSPEGLEAALREIGATEYHDNHPFHHLMYQGQLTIDQIRAWALNRYCYQKTIPTKDAIILARLESTTERRIWRQRIIDHDGDIDDHPEGGLQRWLALAEGLGLDRQYVISTEGALPITKFACNAYLDFVRQQPILSAIASSLTELFSPTIIAERMQGMLANYSFINKEIMRYFDFRLTEAPKDAEFALNYVKERATTIEDQQMVIDALKFKCSLLWSQLDALHFAYVDPKLPPPGVWQTTQL